MKNKPMFRKVLNQDYRGAFRSGRNNINKVVQRLQDQVKKAEARGFTQVEMLLAGYYSSCMLVGIRPETEAETRRRIAREAKEAAKQEKFKAENTRYNAREDIQNAIRASGMSRDEIIMLWDALMGDVAKDS